MTPFGVMARKHKGPVCDRALRLPNEFKSHLSIYQVKRLITIYFP